MSAPTAFADNGLVSITSPHGEDPTPINCTPDEALELASSLITAANQANGITPQGVFA